MLQLVIHLFELFELVVVLTLIVSWFSLRDHPLLQRFPCGVVEPLLKRLRRLLPLTAGAVDFSPLVLIFILEVVRQALGRLAGNA